MWRNQAGALPRGTPASAGQTRSPGQLPPAVCAERREGERPSPFGPRRVLFCLRLTGKRWTEGCPPPSRSAPGGRRRETEHRTRGPEPSEKGLSPGRNVRSRQWSPTRPHVTQSLRLEPSVTWDRLGKGQLTCWVQRPLPVRRPHLCQELTVRAGRGQSGKPSPAHTSGKGSFLWELWLLRMWGRGWGSEAPGLGGEKGHKPLQPETAAGGGNGVPGAEALSV